MDALFSESWDRCTYVDAGRRECFLGHDGLNGISWECEVQMAGNGWFKWSGMTLTHTLSQCTEGPDERSSIHLHMPRQLSRLAMFGVGLSCLYPRKFQCSGYWPRDISCETAKCVLTWPRYCIWTNYGASSSVHVSYLTPQKTRNHPVQLVGRERRLSSAINSHLRIQ